MATEFVNVHAAKTNLPRLLEQVEAGQEVVIARAGRPIARLVPYVEVSASPVVRGHEGRDPDPVRIRGGRRRDPA